MNKYFGEWYFEDIISKINEFKLGTKIRSERGDIYILSQAEGEGKQRKFSRWDGTKLRFMTYENIGRKFEILEDNTEEIEEIELIGTNFMDMDKNQLKDEINKNRIFINKLRQEIFELRKDKDND